MMRAVASVPPPAAHGTTSVTGRSGHAACAAPKDNADNAAAAVTTAWKIFLRISIIVFPGEGGRISPCFACCIRLRCKPVDEPCIPVPVITHHDIEQPPCRRWPQTPQTSDLH